MFKKIVAERIGWRTTNEISHEGGVPISLLCGEQTGWLSIR
jgi:hypothetical protein